MSAHLDNKTKKWYYTGKYKDLTGKRHDYKKRGFATEAKASKAESLFLLSITDNKFRTNLDDLAEIYFNTSRNWLKKTTIDLHQRIYKNHIEEYFGSCFIDKITPENIDAWLDEKYVSSRKLRNHNGDKFGYSASTLKNMLGVLASLLTFACSKGLIQSNPCKYIKRKKFNDPNKIIEKKASTSNYWELATYKQFISTINDTFYYDVYQTLFFTGMREGELCSLRWKDVDLANKKIEINQSYAPSVKEVLSPKTFKSNRIIDMPSPLYNILSYRYEECKKLDGFNLDYYVFGDIQLTHPSKIAYQLDKDIKLARVKRITLHGFRHTHATMLINEKLPDIIIADRLGHSVTELYRTYAHVYQKSRTEICDFLNTL